MQYRPYGNTGHQISALAMGGMRYETPADIDAMAEIPVYLYEQGVNYFDTAPGYCGDRSEEILGAAVRRLQGRGGPRFYLSTKTFGATEAEVRHDLDQSLRRLNVEAIDFYHAWCLRSWPEWQEKKAKGLVAAFRKMKDEGLVRHIVTSLHVDSDETKRLLGEGLFEGLTLGFCATNYAFRQQGIRAAQRAGLGVVAMNPLGGGVYWQAPERFAFLKDSPDESFVRAGLRFVLSFPEITAALVGVRNMSDAREAVAAANSLELYGPRKLSALKKKIVANFSQLCTGCNYCQDCPQGIPVARLMDMSNYVDLGLPEQVWGRAKYHWGIEDVAALVAKCNICRQCEQACTQHLPIRERMAKLVPVWQQGADEAKAKAAKAEAEKKK